MGTNQGTKRGAPRLLAVTSADQIGIKEEDKKSAILKKNKSPEEEIGNWRHPVTVSNMMITGYLMVSYIRTTFSWSKSTDLPSQIEGASDREEMRPVQAPGS